MLKFTSCLILMGCGTLATAADGDFVLDNDGRRYELLPLRQIAIERPANYFYLQMSEDDTLCETVLASYNTAYRDKEPVIQPMLDTYSRNLFHTDLSVAWSEKIRPVWDLEFNRGVRYQIVNADIDNSGTEETIVRTLTAAPYISQNRVFFDLNTFVESAYSFQWTDVRASLTDLFHDKRDVMQRMDLATFMDLKKLSEAGAGFGTNEVKYDSRLDVLFKDVITIDGRNHLALLSAGLDTFILNLFILDMTNEEEVAIRCQFRSRYVLTK